MGTSAGAITGSLYASGLSPKAVAEELSRLPPSAFLVRLIYVTSFKNGRSSVNSMRRSSSSAQIDRSSSPASLRLLTLPAIAHRSMLSVRILIWPLAGVAWLVAKVTPLLPFPCRECQWSPTRAFSPSRGRSRGSKNFCLLNSRICKGISAAGLSPQRGGTLCSLRVPSQRRVHNAL